MTGLIGENLARRSELALSGVDPAELNELPLADERGANPAAANVIE